MTSKVYHEIRYPQQFTSLHLFFEGHYRSLIQLAWWSREVRQVRHMDNYRRPLDPACSEPVFKRENLASWYGIYCPAARIPSKYLKRAAAQFFCIIDGI